MNLIIAGAFSKYYELSKFFLQNKIYENNEICVYDGIYNCKWNGGRINRDVFPNENRKKFYSKRNIDIALTFTNPIIDISDEIGNILLKEYQYGNNRIILVNDELRLHIRKNYPKYKLTYSITGTGDIPIPLDDVGIKIYRDLEDKYDLIVPRMEHIFDSRFLELNQSKYEVMLNDTCVYNCQYYKEHFEAIAEQNTLGRTINDVGCKKIEECWIEDFNFSKEKNGKHGMDLTIEQIKTLQDRGIKYFKISGRELPSEEFLSEIRKYSENT